MNKNMYNIQNKNWVCFFSQTGTEILEISKQLGRFPNKIITNKINLDSVNTELLEEIQKQGIEFCSIANPTVEDYFFLIPPDSLVTLHGYLKIIPAEVCEGYEILNVHPGDVVKYPELKGIDPQAKAIELGLPTTGVVIHECTEDLDGGVIMARKTVAIDYRVKDEFLLNNLTSLLKYHSIQLWVPLLKLYLQN